LITVWPHVHFCCRGSAVVFLDLKRDEYSMIDEEKGFAFRSFFCDPLVSSSTSSTQQLEKMRASANPEHEPLQSVLDELVEHGLLTTDKSIGRPVAPTVAHPPTEPLLREDNTHESGVRATHVLRFFVACMRATILLRFVHIERTAAIIARRKELRSRLKRCDIQHIRHLVRIFNALRSLFPSNYLCMFDSLALLEFLARFDQFPSWVFGVRPELWAAHCWVQEGATVLNEDVDEACDYVPILVI
jgi:hypothetical protein